MTKHDQLTTNSNTNGTVVSHPILFNGAPNGWVFRNCVGSIHGIGAEVLKN